MAGNPNVTIYEDTTSAIELIPIEDGNIIFDTNAKLIYIDHNGKREVYGGVTNMNIIDKNGFVVNEGGNTTVQALFDKITDSLIWK